jgi:hypothetical protein
VRWKYWRNRCARHCSHSTRSRQCLPPPLFVTQKGCRSEFQDPPIKSFTSKILYYTRFLSHFVALVCFIALVAALLVFLRNACDKMVSYKTRIINNYFLSNSSICYLLYVVQKYYIISTTHKLHPFSIYTTKSSGF